MTYQTSPTTPNAPSGFVLKSLVYTGTRQSLVVPPGFKNTVTYHIWGAGGGTGGYDSGGAGGIGASGLYSTGTFTANEGDTIVVSIGQQGGNGTQGGSAAGGYGGASATFEGFNSRNPPAGQPAVYTSTNNAYSSFLNTYGVWESNINAGSFDRTYTVNFPYTAIYRFTGACDNYGTIYLDGTAVLNLPTFTSSWSADVSVSAGSHTVRLVGVNTGGPGSIGLTITQSFRGGRGGYTGPSGWSGSGGGGGGATILQVNSSTVAAAAGGGGGGGGSWNRGANPGQNSNVNSGTTEGASGSDCPSDGGGGGGGGGGLSGGGGGGAGGAEGYDNDRGGFGGYSGLGGTAGSGSTPAGTNSGYHSGTAGYAGNPGYAILLFEPLGLGKIKQGGSWRSVEMAYLKESGTWRRIAQAWIKQGGIWRELGGSGSTVALNFTQISGGFG